MVPLNWAEWLVSIAIGFGACIVSWATRFVSRTCVHQDILALRKLDRARTSSGLNSSSGTQSLKGSMHGVSMRVPMGMKMGSKDDSKVYPINLSSAAV